MTAKRKKKEVQLLDRTPLTDNYEIATYFQLESGIVETTEQIHDNCLICRDDKDNVIGIEIVNINQVVTKSVLYNKT